MTLDTDLRKVESLSRLSPGTFGRRNVTETIVELSTSESSDKEFVDEERRWDQPS